MIFAKNFTRNCEKKPILGTSDGWSMSRLSQQPSNPAYYIEDCLIFSGELSRCWQINQGSLFLTTLILALESTYLDNYWV